MKRRSGGGRKPGNEKERMARRRKRLIMALIAWAVCIGLAALVAVTTIRLIAGVTTAKKRKLRTQAITALESGDYAGAVTLFDEALEKSGKRSKDFNIDVIAYRAEAEFGLGDYEACVYSCDLLMNLKENDTAPWRYIKILCYCAMEDYDQASWLFGQAIASETEEGFDAQADALRTQALLGVCRLGTAREAYEEVLTLCEQALERGESHAQIYNQMGLCKMGQADYDGAWDCFDQGYQSFFTEDVTLSEAAAQAGEKSDEVFTSLKELSFNRAVACEYLGRYEEALTLFYAYVEAFGEDAASAHEIGFLSTR